MGIISVIIIGLIVGTIAKLLMPGKDPGGWIATIVLGLAGSFVGTYLGQALNWYQAGETAGLIGSTFGALLLLLVYKFLQRPRV